MATHNENHSHQDTLQITILLKPINTQNIITGKEIHTEDWNEKRMSEWEHKDASAQEIIITSTERKPQMHLLNCSTSREMMDKLTKIYGKDTEQKECPLLAEFYNYAFRKDGDIASLESTPIQERTLTNLITRLQAEEQRFLSTWFTQLIRIACRRRPEKQKNILQLSHVPTARCHHMPICDHKTPIYLDSHLTRLNKHDNQEEPVAFKSAIRKCFKCNGTNRIARFCRSEPSEHNKYRPGNKEHRFNKTKNNHSRDEQKCNICKKTNRVERDCYSRRRKTSSAKKYGEDKGIRGKEGLYK